MKQKYEFARSIACYFCFGCGAMVRDRKVHDAWHASLKAETG